MGFAVRRGASAIYEHSGSLATSSTAYTRFSGIGYETGSVHSDFGISRLATGGAITAHVHSFEETFYVMDGEVLVATPEATVRLTAGDYGVIPVGVPHSWRSAGEGTAIWADLYSPPPRIKFAGDT